MVDPLMLAQLSNMGYSIPKAVEALLAVRCSHVNDAVAWIRMVEEQRRGLPTLVVRDGALVSNDNMM